MEPVNIIFDMQTPPPLEKPEWFDDMNVIIRVPQSAYSDYESSNWGQVMNLQTIEDLIMGNPEVRDIFPWLMY